MAKGIIQNNKGFTLVELLIVIVIIGVLAVVAVPTYTRYIKDAKAQEALQIFSASMTYVKSYSRAHSQQYPSVNCDTTVMNGEWIDEVVGDSSEFFDLYYITEGISVGGPGTSARLEIRGKAAPFYDSDTLTYYMNFDSWTSQGSLTDIQPEPTLILAGEVSEGADGGAHAGGGGEVESEG